MYKTDQKHMWEDAIDHPKDLLVASKSKRAALVDTDRGDSVFVTGDFSDGLEKLESEVRSQKNKWPFSETR